MWNRSNDFFAFTFSTSCDCVSTPITVYEYHLARDYTMSCTPENNLWNITLTCTHINDRVYPSWFPNRVDKGTDLTNFMGFLLFDALEMDYRWNLSIIDIRHHLNSVIWCFRWENMDISDITVQRSKRNGWEEEHLLWINNEYRSSIESRNNASWMSSGI